MATPTYALYASASFHGEVVEESFVSSGEVLQIGNSSALAVPVPQGCPYVARVTWTSPTSCEVRDGTGQLHELRPGQDLELELGPVQLRLYLVQQFRIRRAEPWSARGSLAWLSLVLMATLLSSQSTWAWEQRCLIAGTLAPESTWVREHLWYCFVDPNGGAAGGPFSAEYLARLLREDLDGEDQGAVERFEDIDRPDAQRVLAPDDIYMPAGNEGPITKMGGAEEIAPEPVRSAEEEDIPVPAKAEAEKVPLFAEDGTPVPAPIPKERTEPDDGVADGLDAVESEDDTVAPDPPAEEEEGWGIPDWYDEKDRALEELEIELMLRMAQHRLRIDPNDPQALSLLSYYQYLAEDYDAALETYDRFIELFPENPAGYNNKALVYKRQGMYDKEEGLYRVALSYQPMDVTAMNNLAVNLSHQGRFEEALAVMQQLEAIDPEDPYADLHRAKIHAEMGDQEQALIYLRRALEGMARLDTLHHIEFRQDIRVDPSFESLRNTERFRAMLNEFYGSDSPLQD
ncbi:MAG TPA: tetratricopeptide repeat protein [Deltaproteobacteria bacterium]|nr:tetratricopeptide repeat protein [Deltaproteobacteria bacterium]